MDYKISSITIKELVDLISSGHLDLKPSYQRNDIWSKNDQQDLIESILKGYPLPNFFIYTKNNRDYEMVDGQQRSRTIYRFYAKQIKSGQGLLFEDIDSDKFLKHKLSVTYITNVKTSKELEEFYVLVNKKGKHLTKPELFKAEFSNTLFLELVEELLEFQPIIDLNLFTEASSKRMNDRDFVEELVAYLMHGVQDKKKIVETIYKKDIDKKRKDELDDEFKKVISRIEELNNIHPISKTRFKQRNDFYTLFNFVHQNVDDPIEVLKHQYSSLLSIAPYISPSVEDCPPLRDYAINCVSQSNSRKAREDRLKFFEEVLKNTDKDLKHNPTLAQIADFIDGNELFPIEIEDVSGYYLIQPK